MKKIMDNLTHTTVFGFPIVTTKIDETTYDKKSIISTIEKNFKINKKRNKWDKASVLHHLNGDESNPEYHKVNYDTLIPVYKKVVSKILDSLPMVAVDFEFTIINYTCLSNSNYMASHFHLSSDFTAVHYIQFDKKHHTATTFENSLPHADYIDSLRPNLSKIFSQSHWDNSWIFPTCRLNVEEDDFCFSPAFLKHKVEPQTSKKKNRITLILNISLTKKHNGMHEGAV